MNPPTIEEQIAVIEAQAECLHESYTDQIELEETGKVVYTEPEIEREIECLRAAIETLRTHLPKS